jgi:hypothetical protein
VGTQKAKERNRKERKRGSNQLEKSFLRTMRSELINKIKIHVFHIKTELLISQAT